MAPRERLGRLVLLEELEAGALGREYRAVRLGPGGSDRMVSVLRFSSAISAHDEAPRLLIEEARGFARTTHSGLARLLSAGRVEQSFYVSSEPVEGRSVAAVLARSRSEGFPFAAEHALMIARRAAAALESLHARTDGSGAPLFHGLLGASRVVVSYEGEVKLRGLGLWRPLRDTGLLPAEERRYLSPEQAAGGPGGAACDVYALSLVLLEALTGASPDGPDPVAALASARLTTSGGERAALPPPLAGLLRRALAREPGARLSRAAELGRELDGLLFSGDFTPTTFDLAFLMHTLFRDDMEREARAVEEALRADYGEFLAADAAEGRGRAPAATGPAVTVTDVPPAPAGAARPAEPARPAEHAADASGPRPALSRASREKGAREAAARLTFGAAAESPGRRGVWLALGLLAALGLGGGGGYLFLVRGRATGPSPLSATAVEDAGARRIRELEARIAELERDKKEAEVRAADEARRKVEAEAEAAGDPPDVAAVLAAEEEARRRTRLDQERRQRQERQRLEDEKKAEERRLAEATPPPAPEPTPTPPPTPAAADSAPPPAPFEDPAPPPTTVPPAPATVRPGSLVDFGDPRLTRPVIVRKRDPDYPDIARRARASGVVELRALVDENGRVADVTIVRSTRPGVRFEEAATQATRGWLYRPATKDGVPVRVWVPVEVRFAP